MRAAYLDARPVAGGTDLMVEINFDRARPAALLDLSGLDETQTWMLVDQDSVLSLGAGMPYARIMLELGGLCPALVLAARTVGSPQIRNRGTVGGNLATASPAGDSHPPLLAARASVEVESIRGKRLIPIDDFFVGPKKSALAQDELIRAIRIPVAAGPRQFSKIGPRNAMVIATASFAISLDPVACRVGTGIGSAGPTPLRAAEAEAFLEAELNGRWLAPGPPDPKSLATFGAMVADAASPIDDVRGTAAYRRHALSVLAQRSAGWVWTELDENAEGQ